MTTNSPTPSETTIIATPWNLDGKRFDVVAQALAESWFSPKLPRSIIQTAIYDGTILLQGATETPKARISKGDKICFTEQFFQSVVKKEDRTTPGSENPFVISDNEWFIALYKPASWLSHEVSDYQKEASLEDFLLQEGLIPAGIPKNGRVHRLDRNTSGIILYAKSEAVQEELKNLFQSRKVKKTYIGLVEGHLEELSGTIAAPIMRKQGSFKRIVTENPEEEGARAAETGYRVIARAPEHDLVLLTPKTGRTHQIRVHMEALGHPLSGDGLYGGQKDIVERQFLHAWSLEFTFRGQKYAFTAPLAKDLKSVLLNLDESTLTRYDNEALQSIGLKHSTGFFSFISRMF